MDVIAKFWREMKGELLHNDMGKKNYHFLKPRTYLHPCKRWYPEFQFYLLME